MKLCTKFVLLLLLLAGATANAAPAPITIVYSDYKTYSWEENGKPVGLEIDILNEAIGKRMGLPLVHKVLPWERAQANVQAGVSDAFVSTLNAQRSSYADASGEAVTRWELALYVRKGDARFANIQNLANLAPYKIGSLIGNGWVKNNLAGMDVHSVGKMDKLPRMLLLGRIDVIPDNPLVIRRLIKNEKDGNQIEELPLKFLSKDMFLYVGKKSGFQKHRTEFDAVMLQMKRDGSLQRIHERYNGVTASK